MQFDFTPLRRTSTGLSCEWKREPPAAVRCAGGFAFGRYFGMEGEGLATMRGADELRNVGSQVVGDIDSVETYGSTCLVRTARSDELLTLGGGEGSGSYSR